MTGHEDFGGKRLKEQERTVRLGPARGLRDKTSHLGSRSVDIRVPSSKELRLAPAVNARVTLLQGPHRAWLPAGTLLGGGRGGSMSDCMTDGWIFVFVIAFQLRHIGLTKKVLAGFQDSNYTFQKHGRFNRRNLWHQ